MSAGLDPASTCSRMTMGPRRRRWIWEIITGIGVASARSLEMRADASAGRLSPTASRKAQVDPDCLANELLNVLGRNGQFGPIKGQLLQLCVAQLRLTAAIDVAFADVRADTFGEQSRGTRAERRFKLRRAIGDPAFHSLTRRRRELLNLALSAVTASRSTPACGPLPPEAMRSTNAIALPGAIWSIVLSSCSREEDPRTSGPGWRTRTTVPAPKRVPVEVRSSICTRIRARRAAAPPVSPVASADSSPPAVVRHTSTGWPASSASPA